MDISEKIDENALRVLCDWDPPPATRSDATSMRVAEAAFTKQFKFIVDTLGDAYTLDKVAYCLVHERECPVRLTRRMAENLMKGEADLGLENQVGKISDAN